MNRIAAFPIILSLLAVGSCRTSEVSPQMEGPAAHPMLVTTEWLGEHLGDPGLVIVHVGPRPDDPAGVFRLAYEAAHIPGARSLAWSEIATTRSGVPDQMPPVESLVASVRMLGIRETDRIVIYDTGCGLEAARAYLALDYLGFADNASLLDGQMRKWLSEDRALVEEPSKATPSAILPSLRSGILVPLQVMRDFMWLANRPESTVCLVDIRPEPEYAGREPGHRIKRAGHIPGAVNVPWMMNVEGEENPILRPVTDLLELYTTQGAKCGQSAVVYGRTGGEAAHTYFTMKLLGYNVRVYDGSYAEWSAHKELPVKAIMTR